MPRAALLLFLLIAASALYAEGLTQLSKQPPGSHPDEYGKAEQIVHNDRNYNHPQFLLANLQLMAALHGNKPPASLVKTGRHISSFYAGLSVLLFSLIGWRLFGVAGGAAFFLAFSLNPALLIAGRYLKEDIFLAFSIALLTLALTEQSQERANLLAGLGCAVAVSSKYIGAVFAVTFLLAYLHHRRWYWHDVVRQMLPVFLLATAIINYKAIAHPLDFFEGLNGEVGHVTSTHDGISMGSWATMYTTLIGANIPLAVWLCTPVLLAWVLAGRRSAATGALLFVSLAAIVYAACIQIAPVKIPRYGFPLLVLIPLAYLLTTGALWQTLSSVRARLLLLVPAAIYAVALVANAQSMIGSILHDTRDIVFQSLVDDPRFTNKRLLADNYAGLLMRLHAEESTNLPPNPNGIRLRVIPFSVDECRPGDCAGFDYVVIACTAFQRFYRPATILDPTNQRRKDAYTALLRPSVTVQRIVSSYEDNEGRYGMYESPCIYVIDAKRLDDPAPAAGRSSPTRQATQNAAN